MAAILEVQGWLLAMDHVGPYLAISHNLNSAPAMGAVT